MVRSIKIVNGKRVYGAFENRDYSRPNPQTVELNQLRKAIEDVKRCSNISQVRKVLLANHV